MTKSRHSAPKVKPGRRRQDAPSSVDTPMSAEALRGWREERRLSRQALASMLGLHVNTIIRMEEGTRRDGGNPVEISKLHRLALAALTSSILDYDGKKFTIARDPNEPKDEELRR